MAEYNQRCVLLKLGYNQNLEELTCFKADCFTIISSEFNKMERRQHEENLRKAKARPRGK